MGATPIAYVDAAGIHRPSLQACIDYFTSGYQNIYGADVYLGSDAQDGELVGFIAAALDDVNQEAVGAYNAFSPATAQGTGLSSVVKINGILRKVPTNSTVPALVVGPAGTTIVGGVVSDGNNHQWSLPASVVIPSAGQITVTLTCQDLGAIALPSGTVMTPVNPTRGWQSTTTTAAATPGAPVETDAQLRVRQSKSTQIPSSTILAGIDGAIRALTGVARLRTYDNDSDGPDANGIPGHSIAIVADGGDAQQIAATIAQQKFAAGTYGSTTETVVDAIGVPHPINFFYLTTARIIWQVTIQGASNYSVATNALIAQSLADWTNALGIGQELDISRAYGAAYLQPSIQAASAALNAALANGDTLGVAAAATQLNALNAAAATYKVTGLDVAVYGNALASADVPILFNQAASGDPSDVTVAT